MQPEPESDVTSAHDVQETETETHDSGDESGDQVDIKKKKVPELEPAVEQAIGEAVRGTCVVPCACSWCNRLVTISPVPSSGWHSCRTMTAFRSRDAPSTGADVSLYAGFFVGEVQLRLQHLAVVVVPSGAGPT